MDSLEELKNSIDDVAQRNFIKFCVILGHSGGVIHRDLVRTIGERAYSNKTVEKWITKFRKGDTSIEEHRGGDSSDHEKKRNVLDEIRILMDQSRSWSCLELSIRLNISKSTVHRYLREELKLIKILSKWVPHDLTEDQKDHRVLASQANLDKYSKQKSLLKRTLAIDETWVSLYMSPQKDQSRVWMSKGEEPPQVVTQNVHGRKRMLILAMDYNGIAFWELCQEKESVNAVRYRSFLSENIPIWLQDKRFKYPIIIHDNARPHKAVLIREYLKENNIRLWNHPPYSPDISPPDFNCFNQLKRELRGINHTSWDHFKSSLKEVIEKLNTNGLMRGVQMLPERWARVIDLEGSYL